MRFMICVLLLSTWVPAALGADDSTDRATRTAEEFVQALKAEDLKAAVDLTRLPFFMQHRTLKTREEFRETFAEFFDDKDLGAIEWKTVAAGSLQDIKDKLDEEWHHAQLKKILTERDRVVLIEVKFGENREKRDLMAFAVAVRDDAVHVVGFVD